MALKQGKDQLVALRLLEKQSEEVADLLMFQTDVSNSKTRDFETIKTKSGNVVSLGEIEYELSVVCYMDNDSPKIDEYEKAFDEGLAVQTWVIDKLAKNDEGKYKAKYKEAYITSFTPTGSVEDAVELTMEFAVYGREKDGYATFTPKQMEVLSEQYEFEDTTIKEKETEGE